MQEQNLIWAIFDQRGTPLTRAAAAIGYECGFRYGEVNNIRIADIAFRAQQKGMIGISGDRRHDLSWSGWTIANDISPDGKTVLFDEQSESAGHNYIVATRTLDGSSQSGTTPRRNLPLICPRRAARCGP